MDLGIFPTTASAVVTIAGAAAVCVAITQWLKLYLSDWRYTNLLALGATFAIVEIAAAAFAAERAGALERAYGGFLVALFGASLATFGWELVSNLLGKAGVGPRADEKRG
jgi:hypothetical protein